MNIKKAVSSASVVLMITLSLLWLGGAFAFLPTDSAVARAFSSRHPGYSVARVIRGGGDSDQFSFAIQYRAPDSSKLRTAQWLVYTSGIQFGWRLDSEELDVSAHTAATNLK